MRIIDCVDKALSDLTVVGTRVRIVNEPVVEATAILAGTCDVVAPLHRPAAIRFAISRSHCSAVSNKIRIADALVQSVDKVLQFSIRNRGRNRRIFVVHEHRRRAGHHIVRVDQLRGSRRRHGVDHGSELGSVRVATLLSSMDVDIPGRSAGIPSARHRGDGNPDGNVDAPPRIPTDDRLQTAMSHA